MLSSSLFPAVAVLQYLRQKNSGFYEGNQIPVNNTAKLSRPNGVPSNTLDERENNQHVQFSLLDVKADYRKTEDFHKGI
jgi:hypothetical protein